MTEPEPPEGMIDIAQLDLLIRTALTGIEYVAPRVAVNSRKGPQAAYFTLSGMTMRADNPRFADLEHERMRLLGELETRERERQFVERHLYALSSHFERTSPEPAGRESFVANVEQKLRAAYANGSFVRKPPRILAESRTEMLTLLNKVREDNYLDLVDELIVAEYRNRLQQNPALPREQVEALLPAPNDDDVQRARKRVDLAQIFAPTEEGSVHDRAERLVGRVLKQFELEADAQDFSELPPTVTQMREYYWRLLDNYVLKAGQAEQGLLPFRADAEEDDEVDYYRDVVRTLPLPEMAVNWLNIWKEKRFPDQQYTSEQLTALDNTVSVVNELVTGNALTSTPALKSVLARRVSANTVAKVTRAYRQAIHNVVRLQAALEQFALDPRYDVSDEVQARSAQERALRSVDPSEAALQTRQVRAAYSLQAVRAEIQARIAEITNELAATEPKIDVPLEVERNEHDTKPIVLAIVIEPASEVQYLSGQFTVRWYHKVAHERTELLSEHVLPRGVLGDSYTLNPHSQQTAFVGGFAAGQYRAVVEWRKTDDPEQFALVSSTEAAVRIFGRCLRDGVRFLVGPGIPKKFGECTWQAAPINRKRALYRQQEQFEQLNTVFRMDLAGGNGFSFVAALDDGVRTDNDAIVISDAELLALAAHGTNTNAQLFHYTGIIARVASRLEQDHIDSYGEQTALALLKLYRQRHGRNDAFLGALLYALEPPDAKTLAGLPLDSAAALLDQWKYTTKRLQQSAWTPQTLFVTLQQMKISARAQVAPVLGTLYALLHSPASASLKRLTSQSDVRFLEQMLQRVEQFIYMYEEVTEPAPTHAKAVERVAVLNAAQFVSSTTWKHGRRRNSSLAAHSNQSEFLVDKEGRERFYERVKAANARSQSQDMTVRQNSFEPNAAGAQLDTAYSLGAPMGISSQTWTELAEQSSKRGLANGARTLRATQGVPLDETNWTGVHNSADSQPTPYNVEFIDGDRVAVVERGSERMYIGYDFRSLHYRIVSLVAAYNQNTQSGVQRPRQKAYIQRLVLVFNALAQFAPKLRTPGIVSAADIERRALTLFDQ